MNVFWLGLLCFQGVTALNFGGLLPGQKKSSIELYKTSLNELVSSTGKNGNKATTSQRERIKNLVLEIGRVNPTKKPANSNLLSSSSWKLSYTDFDPPAPSSGRLGPFTGDVYQSLDPRGGQIKNLLKIDGLPLQSSIYGGLVARQSVISSDTWRIDFDYVTNGLNILNGKIKLGGNRNSFESKPQTRLWKHIYLDEDLRILEARKEENSEEEAFIFITKRVTEIPLVVGDI